jgi:hypothetical protein
MRKGILTSCAVLFAAAVLNVASVAEASVVFSNTGNLSGWSSLWQENGRCSLTQVSSPVYKGSTAVRARCIYSSSYSGRYHGEMRKSGMAQRGQDRYYGFAFYIPSNWQNVQQGFNIQQFIGNASGCSGGQPTTMTALRYGDDLVTRIVTGPSACQRTSTNYTVVTSVSKGTWHRVTFRGKWRSDNTGVFTFWYDGSQKLNKTNTKTHPADDYSLNYAVGNYSNAWHDDDRMEGTQSTRDIFVDHIRVATTYAEADPASW